MTAAIPEAVGELRRWIEATWDPELSLVRWRELLADAGWACPAWPHGCCGRSLPAGLAALVRAELAGAGVPGPAEGVGVGLAGPVLIEHGTDALREGFVRRTVTGEITWCQLFSEPGAGSDLAAEIAAGAPLAVRSIRETMRGTLADRARAAMDRELAEQDRLRQTADFAEGIRASAQRRPPRFEAR